MSSAFFLTTSDEPDAQIFEEHEFPEVMMAFLKAVSECESAELRWSS